MKKFLSLVLVLVMAATVMISTANAETLYPLSEERIILTVAIPRQAVHETISRAAGRLREMEEALGTAARFQRVQNGLRQALAALCEQDYSRAQSLLEELMELE